MPDTARVLYIDDDEGLGRLIRRALSPQSIDVFHVATGSDGLKLLADGSYDAVALDHDLIHQTGLDVIAEMKRRGLDVPVIYLTGSEDARVAVAALKAGAVDYVWKDVHGHYRELLAQSVKSAIEQRRLKREAEAAQQAVREARDRAELLLGEVNHRVANSLALVGSLARLQANTLQDQVARNALQEMQARIMAVANVHRRLYTSSDVRFVDMAAYLDSLVGDLTAVLVTAQKHRTITARVDEGVRMPTDKTVSLGVIVTELVTNACKYAYRTDEPGEVRVTLRRLASGALCLVVEDDGKGWAGKGPIKGTGLGTDVVRAMASMLGSEVVYDPSHRGTRASIEFTLPA
jgi:two-component sensor histidine kinase